MDAFSLHDALQLAVTTERLGVEIYTRFAEQFVDDENLGVIFTRLAKDEVDHEDSFQVLLDQNPRTDEDVGRYGGDEYLRATAISEFFDTDAMNRLKEVKTPEDALRNAIGLEQATLLFYQALRDTIGKSATLDKIIEAERDHLTTLVNVILTN